MKSIRLTVLFPLFSFLAHGQSSSVRIKDSFNTVDNSLVKSNGVLNNSPGRLYSAINQKRQNNEALALKADSVYHAVSRTNRLIDSLQQLLQSGDTTGGDLTLAARLLVLTNTGNDLGNALSDVYTSTRSQLIDKTKMQKLDSVLQSIGEIHNDGKWTKTYFEMTPAAGAITILTKLKNDCTNAAAITLTDIKQHLAG